MQANKHLDNRLGLRGWIRAGRYRFERYLYILHRISGLSLLAYLLMHIYVTGARIYGADAWNTTMGSVTGPVFTMLEFLVMAAFVFHGLNGIRLVLIELGIGIGRPMRQEYPYVNSNDKQRTMMWILMVLVVIILVISALDFFVL